MVVEITETELAEKLLVVINGAPLRRPLLQPAASSLSLLDRILAARI